MPLELAPTYTHSSHYKNPLLALLSAAKAEELKGIIIMEIKDLETNSHRLPWSEPSWDLRSGEGGWNLAPAKECCLKLLSKEEAANFSKHVFTTLPSKAGQCFADWIVRNPPEPRDFTFSEYYVQKRWPDNSFRGCLADHLSGLLSLEPQQESGIAIAACSGLTAPESPHFWQTCHSAIP